MLPYVLLLMGYAAGLSVFVWCWRLGHRWREFSLVGGLLGIELFYIGFAFGDGGFGCVPCGWAVGVIVGLVPGSFLGAALVGLGQRAGLWGWTFIAAQLGLGGLVNGAPLPAILLAGFVGLAWCLHRWCRPGGLLHGRDVLLWGAILVTAPLLLPVPMATSAELPSWIAEPANALTNSLVIPVWWAIALALVFQVSRHAKSMAPTDERSLLLAAWAPLTLLMFAMPFLGDFTEYGVAALLASAPQALASVVRDAIRERV